MRNVDLVNGDALWVVVDADILGSEGFEDGAHAIEVLGVGQRQMDAIACKCAGAGRADAGGDQSTDLAGPNSTIVFKRLVNQLTLMTPP